MRLGPEAAQIGSITHALPSKVHAVSCAVIV